MFTESVDDFMALDGENQTWVFPGQKPLVGSTGNYSILMLSTVPRVYIIKWVLQQQMQLFTMNVTSPTYLVKIFTKVV